MTYNGKEGEVLFDNDMVLHDMVQKYYIIHKDIINRSLPPTDVFYIGRFKDDYNITINAEEFEELADYALNEFLTDLPMQIYSDFASGRIREL